MPLSRKSLVKADEYLLSRNTETQPFRIGRTPKNSTNNAKISVFLVFGVFNCTLDHKNHSNVSSANISSKQILDMQQVSVADLPNSRLSFCHLFVENRNCKEQQTRPYFSTWHHRKMQSGDFKLRANDTRDSIIPQPSKTSL